MGRVYEYDEEVLFHTAKSTILDVMRTPYEGFEDVIRAHFTVKAPQIEQQMREVLKDLRFSTSFRERMRPIIERSRKSSRSSECKRNGRVKCVLCIVVRRGSARASVPSRNGHVRFLQLQF